MMIQFTTDYFQSSDPKTIKSNYTGNNTKNMMVSLEASLKKLRTSYIDIVGTSHGTIHSKRCADHTC